MFIHIKMLWGILSKADSVPKPPSLRDLEEFYSHFSNEQHINKAAQMSSPAIINLHKAELLKEARAGRIQIGKSYLHVGTNFIWYAKGLMACLGFQIRHPNLEEDASSLYNLVCWIAAITTIQELARGKAYAYLNILIVAVDNTAFLIQCYNHFFHFLTFDKYRKEQREAGKVQRDAIQKSCQKAREQVSNSSSAINAVAGTWLTCIFIVGCQSIGLCQGAEVPQTLPEDHWTYLSTQQWQMPPIWKLFNNQDVAIPI